MTARKRLTGFTAGYEQISVIFPFIVVSPAFFAGTIPLGVLTQTASAFGQVQGAFSFFINAYAQLAEWRAVTERLIGFEDAISSAERLEAGSQIVLGDHPRALLSIDELRLRLPSGQLLVTADDIVVEPNESVLVTGRSGSGKSTLFRAIAGIWPFGEGKIEIGKGKKILILPQRPYLPFGRLDDALAYPNAPRKFGAARLAEVLKAVDLAPLADLLDEEGPWPHVLSQGEQQRLSLARALLAQPDVLLLDEATSALDEPAEAALYRLIAAQLPGTTVISIGHRHTLHALHKRRLDLNPDGEGQFTVRPAAIVPE
jgi:putative ATP-binding cassette transporter